jgi:hypothetical protein
MRVLDSRWMMLGLLPVGLVTVSMTTTVAAEASWTATRVGNFSQIGRQRAGGTGGGGTYNGPGDTTGGGSASPPSGMSHHASVCSPLDPQICVQNVFIWDYVVTGLQDGFTYLSGCHAFSEETLLMQSYYWDAGWSGYPAVTCNGPSTDMFGSAQGSHYAVPCASTNPRGLTNGMVLDLGADVISTHNLLDLCDLEIDAGLH